MSASRAAMTQNSLISKPREIKRGACDRCRGQKLRCLREDQSQDSTCVRCFKAGAICSFGTPKRAGRPSASSSYSPRERRGNDGGSPQQGGIPSKPTAKASGHRVLFKSRADGGLYRNRRDGWHNSSFLQENTDDEESGRETEDTIPANLMSPSSLVNASNILSGADVDFPADFGSSNGALPWPDEPLPPFHNDNTGESSGLEPLGPKFSWDFQHYHAGTIDMQMLPSSPTGNDRQNRDVGVNAYTIAAPTRSTNVQSSRPSDGGAMEIDLPSALNQPIKVPCARKRRARDQDQDRAQAPTCFSVSSTAKPLPSTDSAESEAGSSTVNEETLSVKEGQHRWIQELSELAMDLYAQLAANDPESHPVASAVPGTAFQERLVGSVLKSSNTFLTLLTSVSNASSPAYPAASPLSSSTNPDASTCSSSFSGVSPTALVDYGETITDDAAPSYHDPLPPLDEAIVPPPSTDMTTVLQLLTCYIRIVRLHSIMYTSMLDYTLEFPAAASPHLAAIPPVFPGLQIGGVSLDAFGTLQVVLLLQIAAHVLSEIEVALGLPEEYRVGRRKGGNGRGVLEASVSTGFVKSLMREGMWREKRVEYMREQLSRLNRVLKGGIDF